jgi:hypothetical protein
VTPRNADEIVTALDRSMRRVRVSLVLYGVPCLIALAGLGFRGALTGISPLLADYLEIAATVTAVGLLLVIMAGWLATRRALRQLDLRLRESTARLALNRQEIEAAKTRHGLERQIKTLELEQAVASREARLRIRELERALDQGAPALPAAPPEPAAAQSARRAPPTTLNRPRRILPEVDPEEPAAAADESA